MINLPDILANFTSRAAGQSHNAAGNVRCLALILTPVTGTIFVLISFIYRQKQSKYKRKFKISLGNHGRFP